MFFTEHQIKVLAKRLKHFRKKAGYSSAEKFSYQNNINRAQYGKYEAGMDIRFSTLIKILKALKTNPAEFFGEDFFEKEE